MKDSDGETPIELAKKNPAMQQSTVEMLTYLSAGDIKVLQSYPDLLNAIEQKKQKKAQFLKMASSIGGEGSVLDEDGGQVRSSKSTSWKCVRLGRQSN